MKKISYHSLLLLFIHYLPITTNAFSLYFHPPTRSNNRHVRYNGVDGHIAMLGVPPITHSSPTRSGDIGLPPSQTPQTTRNSALHAEEDDYNDNIDANSWTSSNIPFQDDWEDTLSQKLDGTMWSTFETSDESNASENSSSSSSAGDLDDDDMNIDDGEKWLDTIAAISQEEIEFINEEADRADKVRQMQEWGFTSESISSTLGVAVDDSLEIDPENEVYEKFKEETAKTGFGMYLDDDEDLELVESHTRVEKDEVTGEPIRSQMVYVDEHACVGCYHCANIAQSTFFMESDLGRARVFSQWGDDDETIEIAIETCPVDCIHYVPYEELVRLEIDRRDQNINNKARLVNQDAGGQSIGGFTAPQQISGNMGSRCNNCPSKGCKECPMYGIGKNPYFEKREQERKEKRITKRIKERMERSDRTAEL